MLTQINEIRNIGLALEIRTNPILNDYGDYTSSISCVMIKFESLIIRCYKRLNNMIQSLHIRALVKMYTFRNLYTFNNYIF